MLTGELVNFYNLDRLPAGAKKVAQVKENWHTFYRRKDRLFMKNCAGDILEVDNLEGYSFRAISDDYEGLEDEWCPRRK